MDTLRRLLRRLFGWLHRRPETFTFIRFPNVHVPKGAVITEATLTYGRQPTSGWVWAGYEYKPDWKSVSYESEMGRWALENMRDGSIGVHIHFVDEDDHAPPSYY